MQLKRQRAAFVLAVVGMFSLVGAIGCYGEGPVDQGHTGTSNPVQNSNGSPSSSPDAGSGSDASLEEPFDAAVPPPPVLDGGRVAPTRIPCNPLRSSEPLVARSSVMSGTVSMGDRPVSVGELFNQFYAYCGACHTDDNRGGFQDKKVTAANFADVVDEDAVTYMHSNDPDKVMPQGGPIWSKRTADDPIYKLAGLLEQWIQAGRPKDLFWLAADPAASVASPYAFTKELGESLTNIGNCLPDAKYFASESQKSAQLDAMFAAATELPAKLSETDLVSFDSAVLGRYGVVAYVPTYPLWSDDAGKLRYVRVPRGTSIQFDEQTQQFKIPPNTRFYKTFLKKVVDGSGKESYRKIETRLIVSRPDDCSVQPCKVTSLMGTYAWSQDDETQDAPLIQDALRSGVPFGDRLFPYATDEAKASAAAASGDAGALAASQRHYAIPGIFRCVQCHMGSPSQSAILGFTPLQINRKPYVEEPDMFAGADNLLGYGVLKENAPSPDELAQLQRLIDYGVVSGISSPSQVKTLRNIEAVPPRNGYELQAQAYMVGNCAHCHNPRGFPTIQNPVLAPLLNFLPSQNGGIFGFPLDRVSPRVHRGVSADLDIPYITPSLYDVQELFTAPRASNVIPPAEKRVFDASGSADDPFYYVLAPWRSFIWRNVSTPFTYADDYAFFPHMPLNAPGFDCRAPRIMADWMVSLPARRKPADGAASSGGAGDGSATPPLRSESLDQSAQPYVEVKPGEVGYAGAVAAARQRLQVLHDGDVYNTCPDTSDIVDPKVQSGKQDQPSDQIVAVKGLTYPSNQWTSPVPDRAHWTNTDTSDPPGPWKPRRGDWADVIVKNDESEYRTADEKTVVELLGTANIHLDADFRKWALQQRPFAFWDDPDGSCASKLGGMPTIDSLTQAGTLPEWVRQLQPAVSEARTTDPIYSVAPGAAVFQNICINCHGSQGDGQSSLAATILAMTGGHARVADLRDGLFGPQGSPGTNRAVFGSDASMLGIQVDDLAVRYLLWMALGGTLAKIPTEALVAVGNTTVGGERRGLNDPTVANASPNMLNTARKLCEFVLPFPNNANHAPAYDLTTGREPKAGGMLIETNGDAQLWRDICTRGQGRPPIRILTYANPKFFVNQQGALDANGQPILDSSGQGSLTEAVLYDPDAYGDNPVMTNNGLSMHGVSANDTDAWCIDPRAKSNELEAKLHEPQNLVNGQPVPYCPDAGIVAQDTQHLWSYDRQVEWTIRGAMNAGMAVFVYLDSIAHGTVHPALQYNECSKL